MSEYFGKLKRFPLGSICAKGFLYDQMLRGKNGMAGHLYELEPGIIADPYIKRSHVGAWTGDEQRGWGAEISGNYWSAYIQYAYTMNDQEMIDKATEWVNEMLKRQREDGYLGTYDEPGANVYEDYNAWGTMCVMRGLIAFYEVTKRQDVLDAIYNCMLWYTRVWDADNKTSYCGHSIIEPMVFVYELTKDKRLLDFAEEYAEYMCEHDLFYNSYKTFLEDDLHYNCNHTANIGVSIRLPALLYSATGKEKYLRASERIIELLRGKAVHLSGAPVSMSEYLGPIGATTESEYCNFAFYNASYSYMSYITGDAKYGDYMEEIFYNAAQGARKKDERAIAYLSAPNQEFATDESSNAMNDMQVYAPCYPTACCPVNAVAVVPEFIRGMMLRDDNDNVYVTAYGPCSLDYKNISIEEKTFYPFRNSVSFEIKNSAEYSVFLKIPSWAKEYSVSINAKTINASKGDNGYIELRQNWSTGDVIEISFKCDVEVIRVDDSDFSKKYPLAFKYGALLFSYHIPETWKAIAGRPSTPLPDGYSWYNVYPDYVRPKYKDYYEAKALKKYATTWNVAVDERLSKNDFTVEECCTDGYAWEAPYIKLHTHCYRAPFLCSPYPNRTFEPFGDKQFVTDKLDLELVPYGCTNLRITYFPIADLSKKNT